MEKWGYYIAIAIGGAIAIVVLGISFFLIYRRPITALIDRIRTIDRRGITTEPSQAKERVERDPRAEAEKLVRGMDSAMLRETEETITKTLEQRGLLGAEAVPVLIRYLASLYIAIGFEEFYRLIYGSQLSLLIYLNGQSYGQPSQALRPFYATATTQYPQIYRSYSFDQWLRYLRDNLLIREDSGLIRITVRGREFLGYLTREGRSINKVG